MTDWLAVVDLSDATTGSSYLVTQNPPEEHQTGSLSGVPECIHRQNVSVHIAGDQWVSIAEIPAHLAALFVVVDGVAACTDLAEHREFTSAAESVASAYLKWGADCVYHIDGQWTFLVVDRNRRMALAARDATGTRALHYRFDGARWIFGSRARDLASVPGLPVCSIDEESILEWLVGVSPRPWSTMFSNVKSLPHGSRLSVAERGSFVGTWWQPVPWGDGPSLSEAEHQERFDEALGDSIRASFRHAKSPCVALSGGLDSSTIAALASRIASSKQIRQPIAVSARFPEYPECDESLRIRTIVDTLRLEAHWVEPNVADYPADVLLEADHPQEAIGMPVLFAVGRLAAKLGSDVIAVGSLGDIVGGRRSHWPQLVGESPDDPQSALLANLGRCLRRGRTASLALLERLPDWFLSGRQAITRALRRNGAATVRHRIAGTASRVLPGPFGARAEECHVLGGLLDGETQPVRWMFERLGINVAFPFLDKRVVEASLSLPASLRFRLGLNRWAERQSARQVLPDEIRLNGQKAVFNSFYRDYQRNLIRSYWPSGRSNLLSQIDFRQLDVELSKALDYDHPLEMMVFCAVIANTWLGSWPGLGKEK